jgi:hypothetical protein
MLQALRLYLHDALRLLALECAFCLEFTQCSCSAGNAMDAARFLESEDASRKVCKVFCRVYVGFS